MKSHVALLASALLSVTAASASAQGAPPGSATGRPTDAQIRQALAAIESANSYREILDATEQYETIIASPRTVELSEALLRDPALDGSRRGIVAFERQLSIDCGQLGPTVAARLLSARIVAASALLANAPEQLAAVLGSFSELSGVMTPQVVRDALAGPGSGWPPALIPLMEQLARDWPQYGALEAARRMASGAQDATSSSGTTAPPAPQTSAPPAGPALPGHWRNTRIVFELSVDTHLVLNADGSAETWTVRASGQEAPTRGRWRTDGTTLNIEWEDGARRSQRYTFYQGQPVLPNIPNQRQFWELMR